MILITGVTGKTGGEVARRLATAGVPFRALVRDPAKVDALKDLDAEIVVGDIGDAETLKQALDGVDKAFLVLPNVEQQLVLEKQFIDAAVAAGVKHVVYLSSMESVPESKAPITRNHVAAENYLRESGLAWTMIRPTFFMQNFEGSAHGIREAGRLVMPVGNGTVSATDLRDVGEIIRDVLTQPGHENQSYDLTGPDLLTFAEIAERFSKVLGKDIQYIDQPMDEFGDVLRSIGFSEWRVEAVCLEIASIAAGAGDHTTETIRELLGRPPHSLEEFIEDNLGLFRA